MGIFKFLCGCSGSNQHKKKKMQLQIVELKVIMDRNRCEVKVKKALFSLNRVESVDKDRIQQKVTVTGYVEAKKVLKKAKSTGKSVLYY